MRLCRHHATSHLQVIQINTKQLSSVRGGLPLASHGAQVGVCFERIIASLSFDVFDTRFLSVFFLSA